MSILKGRLRVQKGDSLHAVETEQGIELTPYNPELGAQLDAAVKVMREDHEVLRKLAD